MKNLIPVIILVVLSFLVQQIGPWWIAVLPALAVGYWKQELKSWNSFALGFFSLFLLWAGWSLYSNFINDGILSSKIGELFGGLNNISLVAITSLIGGVLGGLGTLSGKWCGEALN